MSEDIIILTYFKHLINNSFSFSIFIVLPIIFIFFSIFFLSMWEIYFGCKKPFSYKKFTVLTTLVKGVGVSSFRSEQKIVKGEKVVQIFKWTMKCESLHERNRDGPNFLGLEFSFYSNPHHSPAFFFYHFKHFIFSLPFV